jgi:hypothetical protein
VNFDAFMELSSFPSRDHTWKIPIPAGLDSGEHVKLDTTPGLKAFPDGVDLSVTAERTSGNSIIDTMKRLRDLDD